MTGRLLGLPPLDPPGARILVLGSFPSARSLELGRYYGHERNHFWEVLGEILGGEAPEAYEGRVAWLAGAGIAVWDVIGACEREGSLDQDIRAEEPNPILAFLTGRPSIRRVALNGGKAARAFARWIAPERGAPPPAIGEERPWGPPAFRGRPLTVVRLPSTSPVPTRAYRRAADKVEAWRRALGPELRAGGPPS